MVDTDDSEILAATAEGLGYALSTHRLVQEGISGDGIVRAYETTLERIDAEPASENASISQVIYLETSHNAADRDGVLVFRNEETDDEVAVWLYPKDPALPALPTVVYPQAAGVILQKMGVDPAGLSLDLVAYRPGRRAVVRMRTAHGVVFMKVVRPRHITELHERYRNWAGEGIPVPTTLGWNDDGLIGFAALPGVPSQEVIEHLDDSFLDSVEALTERYGWVVSDGKARTSLALRCDWYAQRLTRRHPGLGSRVAVLEERINARLRSTDLADERTVHSDLHLGQIFVDPEHPGTITGVLDIDTAGTGDPADDAAAMYAHMLVSADFAAERGHRTRDAFERLAESWRARWVARGTAFAVRAEAIAATHLIAHGLGGLVPPEKLLERAEMLLPAAT